MESQSSAAADARRALDLIAAAREDAIEQAATPWWLFAFVGVMVGAIVLSFGSHSVVVEVATAAAVLGVGAVVKLLEQRRPGVFITRLPKGRARNLWLGAGVVWAFFLRPTGAVVSSSDGWTAAWVLAVVEGTAMLVIARVAEALAVRDARRSW